MPPKVIRMPANGQKVATLIPVEKPKQTSTVNTNVVTGHKCVMCETSLGSKQELQDHFRLHANGTIDMKGKLVKGKQPQTAVIQTKNTNNKEAENTTKVFSKDQISCDVCQEAFETVTIAIQHKFRKHPNSNVKYYCGFCGKQYPLEICKSNHIKADHKNDRRTNEI